MSDTCLDTNFLIQFGNEISSCNIDKACGRKSKDIRHDSFHRFQKEIGDYCARQGSNRRQDVVEEGLVPRITAFKKDYEISYFLGYLVRNHRKRGCHAKGERRKKSRSNDRPVNKIVKGISHENKRTR